MNYSGEVADQMVRMSLNGVEVMAKITGAGAKGIATYLYAALKDQQKTKGKARLTSMLKSGKPLKVFAVKGDDLKRFMAEARRYGVLYCVLRSKEQHNGLCDIMVRAEDASKINRIMERFSLSSVDSASILSEVEQSKQNPKQATTEKPRPSEPSFKSNSNSEWGIPEKTNRPSVREKLKEITKATEEPTKAKEPFFKAIEHKNVPKKKKPKSKQR